MLPTLGSGTKSSHFVDQRKTPNWVNTRYPGTWQQRRRSWRQVKLTKLKRWLRLWPASSIVWLPWHRRTANHADPDPGHSVVVPPNVSHSKRWIRTGFHLEQRTLAVLNLVSCGPLPPCLGMSTAPWPQNLSRVHAVSPRRHWLSLAAILIYNPTHLLWLCNSEFIKHRDYLHGRQLSSETKAPFIATQLNSTRLNSTSSWVELSRFGHPLRRTTPIANGRWAARSQSVLSTSVRCL